MSEGSSKLAQSRRAIVDHVQRRQRRRESREQRVDDQSTGDLVHADDDSQDTGGGWFGGLRHAVSAWWRHHPAHLAVELATPALAGYARRKPVQFIGIAAATGAVVLLARPWKLISATGLVVALLKSSQLSGLLMSAVAMSSQSHGDRRGELPRR